MNAKWACFLGLAAMSMVVGCSSSSDSGGGATDSGASGDSPVVDTGSGSQDSAATDSGGADTTDTAPSKCDPAGATACVGCGTDACGAGKQCCGSGSTRACAAGCEAGVAEACDGPEDCPGGGQCCVVADVRFSDASSATATCGSSCDVENASTGSSDIVKAHSCRSGADCGDVADSFGVPYPNCCHAKDLDVGVCVSDTYADQLKTSAGATCN
jgi:hypothetical protein